MFEEAECITHHHRGETWCANLHVRASKMQDRKIGAQTRWYFSHLTLILRREIDVQGSSCLEWIHAISNLTGSVLYCCWPARESWRKMRERTWYDALTYIASKQRMRELSMSEAKKVGNIKWNTVYKKKIKSNIRVGYSNFGHETCSYMRGEWPHLKKIPHINCFPNFCK